MTNENTTLTIATNQVFIRLDKETGKTTEFPFSLTPAMMEYFIQYGIRQSCSDAFAPVKEKGFDACAATLTNRLAKMENGVMPSMGGDTKTPLETILQRVVAGLLRKEKGFKKSDAEASVRAGAEKSFRRMFPNKADTNWPVILSAAETELAARAGAKGLDLDL